MSAEIVVSLEEQIACLARELKIREACYPKWIEQGRMQRPRGDHEIAAMRAALATLTSIRDNPPAAPASTGEPT